MISVAAPSGAVFHFERSEMVPGLTKKERNARLRPLARLALGIALRNDVGAFIDGAAGRFRTFCVQHNEIAIDYYRAIER